MSDATPIGDLHERGERAARASRRAFWRTLAAATAGGASLGAGIGTAFARSAAPSDLLVALGVALLVYAWLQNLTALYQGVIAWRTSRRACPWILLDAALLAGSLWWGWVLLHL